MLTRLAKAFLCICIQDDQSLQDALAEFIKQWIYLAHICLTTVDLHILFRKVHYHFLYYLFFNSTIIGQSEIWLDKIWYWWNKVFVDVTRHRMWWHCKWCRIDHNTCMLNSPGIIGTALCPLCRGRVDLEKISVLLWNGVDIFIGRALVRVAYGKIQIIRCVRQIVGVESNA